MYNKTNKANSMEVLLTRYGLKFPKKFQIPSFIKIFLNTECYTCMFIHIFLITKYVHKFTLVAIKHRT